MSPKRSVPRNTTKISRAASKALPRSQDDTFRLGSSNGSRSPTVCICPYSFNNLFKRCQADDAYREHRKGIEVASAAKRKAALDKLTLLIKQCSAENERHAIKGTADAAVRAMVIIRRA
ncbi:hypothetical protein SISSUDRAFT_198735 [Sistotremastrum suecicum HHB10207 ss-3]|uniref:Uncharacterized protein n=1 Tax=Sistotremastrum suecicum HHB10207 ss-3 TaxID=1314776 RepID=A0A166AA73_9AGAM|nr:hypothetical protein SISSUDRAFT_198735 [Sistotremastrum suecicum HHB10207 ss-3]